MTFILSCSSVVSMRDNIATAVGSLHPFIRLMRMSATVSHFDVNLGASVEYRYSKSPSICYIYNIMFSYSESFPCNVGQYIKLLAFLHVLDKAINENAGSEGVISKTMSN